ncbi:MULTISPECIES: ABC transporter ATP-binding protein [Acidiplasma]|jgi:ATP-binding cassette subfamily B protein|uniref:Multidrug ABC transporter permease n=1 Tax=Acidiplasma aeolicum TaxID=507754 RepID=A0A0Q0VMK4_9ARCH|nr:MULTISPECIES: ABC transporter ATP-binding protein [Acidiplasma]KPV46865.1 multidrug ABC transporter permease [Acidiplasma aeolicum]KQB34693.1 multidrug ABC transporter permease [Acidiplasma aeolicum]
MFNKYLIRLIRQMLGYRKNSLIIIISIIATSAVSMLGPLFIGLSVDYILDLRFRLVVLFSIIYILVYFINYIASKKRTFYSMITAQQVIKSLRQSMFKNLQYVPLSYYGQKQSGQIISRITNDAETLSEFLTFQLPQVAAGVIGIIASIIIMVYLDPVLTAYAIIVIPFLLAVIAIMSGKIRYNYHEVRRKIAALTGGVSESINGINAVKSNGAEDVFERQFESLNRNNFNANVNAVKLTSIFSSMMEIIEAAGIILVLYMGGMQILSGTISIGLVVSFVIYVQGFFTPIVQLSQFYNSYQSSSIAVERIYRIIDEPAEENHYDVDDISLKESIKLINVDFSYNKTRVLKNISMEIKKGEKIALVGRTGAGKTTITNLILKFYHPDSGSILMDNIDISRINTYNYRKHFGVILQDPFLFDGTILDNIKFSNENITEEEIKNKINDLGLSEVFSGLNLHDDIGMHGNRLSEGQRQAVSILRAVIKNPDIIIMDEATSELDSINEKRIQDALLNLMADKTMIIIAHHIKTILHTDAVYYLDNGSIVEYGNPQALLKKEGKFYRIYKSIYTQN